MRITTESALAHLELLYRLNGIGKTAAGDFVIAYTGGWASCPPNEAAEDLAGRLESVDAIRAKISELAPEGVLLPMPELVLDNFAICFDEETAFGEPQAWLCLKDKTSVEITHEEQGLTSKDQYFSVRHHCSEEDFENGAYDSTMGVIEQCAGNLADIAEMLERIVGETGIESKPEMLTEAPEPEFIDWPVIGPRAVFSLISMLYEKKLYQGLDDNRADRESDEDACEMTGLTLEQLGKLYDSAGFDSAASI